MQRLSIQCLNVAVLVMVFIGLPAATRAQLGNWQISPALQSQWLMFWGLALAAAGNAGAALGLIKSPRERKLCGEWTAVFVALLLVQYAFNRGYETSAKLERRAPPRRDVIDFPWCRDGARRSD